MKAVVVIDIPDEYLKSGLVSNVAVYSPTNEVEPKLFVGSEVKPLPEYEVNNDPENEYHKRWVNGYNAFLRYLKGEEE